MPAWVKSLWGFGSQEGGAARPSCVLQAAQFLRGGSLFTPHALSARASPRGRTKSPICYPHIREQLNARAQAMSLHHKIIDKASRVVPLGLTRYKRDWEGLVDAATLLGVPRDPLSQAAHEALTKAGMRGKRFRAWIAGGGASVVLGGITDPVAFNAVACGVETSEVLNRHCFV